MAAAQSTPVTNSDAEFEPWISYNVVHDVIAPDGGVVSGVALSPDFETAAEVRACAADIKRGYPGAYRVMPVDLLPPALVTVK